MADSYEYQDDPRAEVHDFVPAQARRVLDVGCARGGFGAELKRQRPGIVVHGVEINPVSAAVAAERLDEVHVGRFPDDVPEGTFDVITFLDVLEHLVDPQSALQSAKAVLSEEGVVVASIPNVRHYTVIVPLVVSGRWDYKDEGILDRTHLRFFTKETMRECFRDAGYSIREMAAMSTRRPPKRSLLWAALCTVGRRRREEMTTVQYAIVAKPR